MEEEQEKEDQVVEAHEVEKDIVDYSRDLDNVEANPLVLTLYEFLTEPRSSKAATYWGYIMAYLFLIRVIAIGMESCDGPNQYEGRENRARYKFLFSADQYWVFYAGLMIPIVVDSLVKLILMIIIFFSAENRGLKKRMLEDRFTMAMYIMDIIGVLAFFCVALYLRPNKIIWQEAGRLFLRVVELCGSVKVLRLIKDVAAIYAIRKALSNSMEHLKVPVYFFFTFNITASVFLYFLEPCYNTSNCPWKNLFDVSFYSVVSMTTTGYGNQVPYSVPGRFFGCCIMLFGALFMSMPLAIIGNNYEMEWSKVKELSKKKEQEEEKRLLSQLNAKKKSWKKVIPMSDLDPKSAPGSPDAKQSALAATDPTHAEIEKENYNLIHDSPLILTYKQLTLSTEKLLQDISHSFRLSPTVLSGVCELRGQISTLLILLRNATFVCAGMRRSLLPSENYEAGKKRLALYRTGDHTMHLDGKAPEEEKDDTKNLKNLVLQKVMGTNSINLIQGRNRMAKAGHFISRMYKKSIQTVLAETFGLTADTFRKRALANDEFEAKLKEVTENPTLLRNRVWVLLELPDENRFAKVIQIVLVVSIVLTVFILYTETMLTLTQFGEETKICHDLINIYCSDKNDKSADPGCYAFNTSSWSLSDQKLRFNCDDWDCVGKNHNFGSGNTNLTCSSSTIPFQDMDSLYRKYGPPEFVFTREMMHQVNPICTRIECTQSDLLTTKGNLIWNTWEIISNIIFSIEFILRIIISKGLFDFFRDRMNIFDMLSIFPFYTELFSKVVSNRPLDFSILASSPEKVIFVFMRSFKIFRLFKLSRSFTATRVLTGTAAKAWKQILGIISYLVFLVVIFAVLLYEVEKGRACYYGDEGCTQAELPKVYSQLEIGDLVYINKVGKVSGFSNVLYCLWFSFVTLTTTGYGDIVPVTSIGQMMAIFIMLAGSFYMAMPLTAAASVFYREHISFNKVKSHTATVDKENEDEDEDDIIDDVAKNILIIQSEFMDSEQRLKNFVQSLKENAVINNGREINENITSYDQAEDVQMANINIMKGYDRDGSGRDSSKLVRKISGIVEEINQLIELHKHNIKKLAIYSARSQLEQIENILNEGS